MAATTAEEDHPRIRGEHVGDLLVDLFDDGSSPHTRGARELLCADRLRCRIIPAYAGSTGATAKQLDEIGDHPRIRGEHIQDTPLTNVTPGSSPHTRGARC